MPRLGLLQRPLTVKEVLSERRFPSREPLPRRWARYYWRTVATRQIPHGRQHRLTYAGRVTARRAEPGSGRWIASAHLQSPDHNARVERVLPRG